MRVNQAISNGTGYAELRTRIDSGETELSEHALSRY